MRFEFTEIHLTSEHQRELVDITREISKMVARSGIRNGVCIVFSLHTTSGIIINENEEGLREDILRKATDDYPPGPGWKHDNIDDNAAAHLAGTFIGPSVTIIIKNGDLVLGTWQSVFFLELDGPRSNRRVALEVMGE